MPLSHGQKPTACLALADGTIFYGKGFGATGETQAELCFNTAMTGYQEIMTDPSYAGQIVTFTFPHIGNVGTNREDVESASRSAVGLVLHERITTPSNFRSSDHFFDWLADRGVSGISGVDTRALTRKIRAQGPQNAVIYVSGKPGQIDVAKLREKAAKQKDLKEYDLTMDVATAAGRNWSQSLWRLGTGYGEQDTPAWKVVVVDYGVKSNILRHLSERGCELVIVSPKTSAEAILKEKPDGIFLSNGPGDPITTAKFSTPIIQKLVDSGLPVFGICLGHQLLALALGGKTEKMRQGHRGANHPIRNLKTGEIEITSQNHGYAVTQGSLPDNVRVTHTSLFDGSIAGLELTDHPVFAVQYHPESSPGPHDSRYLFDQFMRLIELKVESRESRKASV